MTRMKEEIIILLGCKTGSSSGEVLTTSTYIMMRKERFQNKVLIPEKSREIGSNALFQSGICMFKC